MKQLPIYYYNKLNNDIIFNNRKCKNTIGGIIILSII